MTQPAMLQHLLITVVGAPLLCLLIIKLDQLGHSDEEEKDGPLLRVLKWAAGGAMALSLRYAKTMVLDG